VGTGGKAPSFGLDAKIYTIFEGTSEIQRLVISRAISGMQIR
jgi:acyl-CoA dehydrogenase